MTATITQIHRYPVKGLNAESLARVTLAPGQGLPHDRRFALAHGSTHFDPKAPDWQFQKLAQLRLRFDEDSGDLAIDRAGKQVVHAKATEPFGHTLIEQFFAGFMGAAVRGTPRLLEAPGHMFSDAREKCVSLINLASVDDLERVMRAPVDPLRFRANIYFEGVPAWTEFHWLGNEIGIGAARLRVFGRIDRCAATNVNPKTAERDMNIPKALQRGFGHIDMGVYAEVTAGGDIATGDEIVVR